jgi:thioredoxin-like negative regulator of GroEL
VREVDLAAPNRNLGLVASPDGLEALRENGRPLDVIPLVEAISLAEPENENALMTAIEAITELHGVDAARAHVAKVSARSPASAAVRAAEEKLRGRTAP